MAPRAAASVCAHHPVNPPPLMDKSMLVDEFIPTIRYHASVLKHRLPPHIEMDDLVSSGVVGLLDAADRFDASRGIKFKTYAEFRIRGTMLDYLREMDYFPRSARQHANRLQAAYARVEARLGRPAEDQEAADELGIPLEELQRQLSRFSGLTVFSLEESQDAADGAATGVAQILAAAARDEAREEEWLRDLKDTLGKAIDMLPAREKQLIALYYSEDLTMNEISMIFKVGEPRVCQLHAQAVMRLRGKLKNRFG